MTTPIGISFKPVDIEEIESLGGALAIFVAEDAKLDKAARRINRLSKGAVQRAVASDQFKDAKSGSIVPIGFPAGVSASSVFLIKLEKRAGEGAARAAGANLAKRVSDDELHALAGNLKHAASFSLGLALRTYSFNDHRTGEADKTALSKAVLYVNNPETVSADAKPLAAVAEGVFFTRDLTNEPANILTTDDFAARLAAMQELGLEVEILEEEDLAKLGMNAFLAVGFGSATPTKMVVMHWRGGGDEAPLALVGKGVVFDTGGISIKPAGGMEDMTMDMGGAGVVAGVMRTLALRQAKANVVGLVGLVENMPDGLAQRPGDVVRSMKGDTIEVINTDAEGRLVLCDVLWYAQDRFNPSGIIDLATLTGAAIIALGHENAAVYANDDGFADSFLKAAKAEEEGAWRMPLGAGYDKMLESRIADMKNVGGRPAGSITAAQFLKRFVKDEVPWIHLDIAGVASLSSASKLAPKGATGWGVRALNRMIKDGYESNS